MITVITPVYNKEKFIRRTIESVLNQTYKDYEYLLINDGSTDRSKEIIEEYMKKDSRIRLINQENKGVSKARNEAIKNAKGDYILNIDADDQLFENAVETVNNKIKDNDVLIYKTLHRFKDKEFVKPKRKAIKKDFALNFLKNYWISINAICIRKNYLLENEIFYDEDLNFGEDVLFIIKVMTNTDKIIAIDDILNIYNREVEGSLSSEDIKNIEKEEKWIKKTSQYLDSKNLYREKKVLLNYIKAGNIYQRLNNNKNSKDFKKYYDENIDFLKNIKIANGLRSILLKKRIHDLIKSVEK